MVSIYFGGFIYFAVYCSCFSAVSVLYIILLIAVNESNKEFYVFLHLMFLHFGFIALCMENMKMLANPIVTKHQLYYMSGASCTSVCTAMICFN